MRGRLPVNIALRRLLSGTGLTTRQATSGAWIIERPQPSKASFPQDLAAPEILVLGRRTENADIRRRENDIQPYQIAVGEDVVESHRDNLDQFFQSRITTNTEIAPPSLGQNGDTSSAIDLRGLGSNETLVQIDGRRMPGVPGTGTGFGQPDINALPLHAIERVETLTGTAGGIYGMDALGGVVNVVLRHDYHGLEMHATTGINSRGDARRLNLEGGVGFTPDHGRTDVSIYVSYSWQQPLLEGQSGLVQRNLQLHNRFAPGDYATGGATNNSVFVASGSGDNLILKPEYGGTALGSGHSYVPLGFAGTQAALGAALVRHAGQMDFGLSPNEKASDIDSTPTTTSAMVNIRHRFGDSGVEAYFDALILRNQGRYRAPASSYTVNLPSDSPLNPFQNPIDVTFPAPAAKDYERTSYDSDRYTAGIIVPLPGDWRANADATFGSARYHDDSYTSYLDSIGFTGVDCPNINPFGSSDEIRSSLAPCQHSYRLSEKAHNRYREQSLRLAGPVFQTAAGPTTLTVLLQNRSELAPPFSYLQAEDSDVEKFPAGAIGARTRSIYGELAAPLIRPDAAVPIIKGLTLQLAVRHDWQRISYPGDTAQLHPKFAGTMYTLGAKFYPMPWLMLRGSYATGRQPPPSQSLNEVSYSSYIAELIDPKRGGVQPYNQDQYIELVGDPTGKIVSASTLSLGMVFNPDGDHGPRISIDYSHTRETNVYADPDPSLILAREDTWPERVTREPLTDEDRARGYTGGVITMIDARGLSFARINVKSLDARLDWHVPFAGGILRTYGSLTRQFENRQAGAVVAEAELVGFVDGPLKWRANGGAEWSRGRTTLGANLQYFGRYRIVGSQYLAFATLDQLPQGSKYVKAQAYLDLSLSRRFQTSWAGKVHEMSLDLGVINVLDHAPSYQANSFGPQASLYGDPRQRRFELTLNASF